MMSSSSSPAEFYRDRTSLLSIDSSVFYSEPPPVCDDPLDFFTINVGGSRYVLSQELLASHPETRLGKLALSTRDSALELCDDADFLENEFFFDRSSQTFQYVINFYRTGHLHVREELCVLSFLQEIEYWGIDELCIDPCCRERYYRRKELKESLDVRNEAEADESQDEDFNHAACPDLRRRLWELLEKPESSRAARAFGTLSIIFVAVSIVNIVLISLDLGDVGGNGIGDESGGSDGGTPFFVDALEYVCVVWFTGELVLRFVSVRNKCRFTRSVPNVIDLLAILPFYVTLAVESLHGGSTELENMGRVVQVLRLMRSLRMLKLGRHSTGNVVVYPNIQIRSHFNPVMIPKPDTATYHLSRQAAVVQDVRLSRISKLILKVAVQLRYNIIFKGYITPYFFLPATHYVIVDVCKKYSRVDRQDG